MRAAFGIAAWLVGAAFVTVAAAQPSARYLTSDDTLLSAPSEQASVAGSAAGAADERIVNRMQPIFRDRTPGLFRDFGANEYDLFAAGTRMNVAGIAPSPTVTDGPNRTAEASEGRGSNKMNDRDADDAVTPARQATPTRMTGRLLDIKV